MATIRKRGKKWQVQIRRRGQSPISRSFHFRKDANTWAREMERRSDLRELPPNPRLLEQFKLGDLVLRYLKTVTIYKRGGDYEDVILRAFLRHPICTRRLSELSGRHFAEYRDERLKEIKPASLRRQLAPLHNLFEVARTEWGIPLRENPVSGLKLKVVIGSRERRLKGGELERLIDAARMGKNPYLEPLIRLAIETGMRRGEMLSLEWQHLDRQKSTLLIPTSKNGQIRTIPLTQRAWAVLDIVPAPVGPRVFPITPNAFRLAWERLKRRAGIEDLHFHDLRHEAISQFFEKGLTTPEVALLSGHRDMRMLFRYAHPLRLTALKKLEGRAECEN